MKRFFLGICVMLMTMTATAQTDKFCIAKDGKAATIVVDNNDWKGVLRAANNLGDDVRKVSGTAAAVVESAAAPQQSGAIIAGTIGKSRAIDRLMKQKKIDVKQVKGQHQIK